MGLKALHLANEKLACAFHLGTDLVQAKEQRLTVVRTQHGGHVVNLGLKIIQGSEDKMTPLKESVSTMTQSMGEVVPWDSCSLDRKKAGPLLFTGVNEMAQILPQAQELFKG